jgi:hypothetical protein
MHDKKWFKSVTRIIVDVVALAEVLYFYGDVGHFDNPVNKYPESSG